MRTYYVYILASYTRTLYIGVTNNIYRRIYEHKRSTDETFVGRYKCHFLVYYEEYQSPLEAIAREKQIKKWSRRKKEALVIKLNPEWMDLIEKFSRLV